MKVRKSLLMIVIPIAIGAIGGYLTSRAILNLINEGLSLPSGKEFLQLPDFQLVEFRMDEKAFEYVSYLYIPPKVVRKKEERERSVEAKKEEKPPSYKVTFTYVGAVRSFAIIDGRLFREGDMVSENERIIKINRDGVLLSGKRGERWIKILE